MSIGGGGSALTSDWRFDDEGALVLDLSLDSSDQSAGGIVRIANGAKMLVDLINSINSEAVQVEPELTAAVRATMTATENINEQLHAASSRLRELIRNQERDRA